MSRLTKIYLVALAVPLLIAAMVAKFYTGGWGPIWLWMPLGVAGAVATLGLMEYAILPALSLWRIGAIVRVTYYEALLHPFTLIVVGLSVFFITWILGIAPYYTLGEDTKMYRDVASQLVQVVALAIMVFASSKVVDEEIENRTMLTLMSKPIGRWQVVVGKYLGIVTLVGVVIVVLGMAASITSYLRYFEDMRMDLNGAADRAEYDGLLRANVKSVMALAPLFVLQFFQIATLAAIAVAISTRWPLALNVTVITLLYIGANLTRFSDTLHLGTVGMGAANTVAHLLPYLTYFDIDQRLIYGNFTLGADTPVGNVPTFGAIWGYVAMASVYGVIYITAALALATALFRTRELT